MAGTGEALAWGWVGHLRTGGTTTWRDWRVDGSGAGESRGRYLPGAQQLELLRRLNLAGRPSAELARRVVEASAPGRGTPDLELVGAVEESAFGPRPIEPTDLPDSELTRVATGLIAEDVARVGVRPHRAPRFTRPWRPRYRLVGDPWLADPVRAELVRRGRPPGGRGATVYVLGTDLATMLADAWTARCFAEGGPGWREWLEPLTRRPRLPPRIDLVQAAATWSHRVGRGRVEVVLEPGLLPRLLGTRRTLPAAPSYTADAVDLTRRVGTALGLLVRPGERTDLLRHGLGPRLPDRPGAPLAVPREHLDWVRQRAVRVRDDLLFAGYAVHGDPDALLPATESVSPGPESDPDEARVLALALRLLLEPVADPSLQELSRGRRKGAR